MKDNLTYIFFTKRKYIYIISAVLIISGIIMSVYGNSQNDIEKEIRLMDLKNPIYSENPNLVKKIHISSQHTKTLTTLTITNRNTQPIYMLHITYKNTHSKLKNSPSIASLKFK